MDEKNAWITFEKSGKVSDYLLYKGCKVEYLNNTTEADLYANQNKRDCTQTTQHW